MRIFLDDERFPPDDGNDWLIIRSLSEMKQTLGRSKVPPEFVSFDHDLGDGPTGHDCAKLLVELDQDVWNSSWNMLYYVHSQNPIGKKNIEGLLDSWKKFKEK